MLSSFVAALPFPSRVESFNEFVIDLVSDKSKGVEAISPSPEGEMNFQAHNICGERKMTHMEGLDNLDKVVGKGRFTFVGFPLKLRGGSGSPIRAAALFDR